MVDSLTSGIANCITYFSLKKGKIYYYLWYIRLFSSVPFANNRLNNNLSTIITLLQTARSI